MKRSRLFLSAQLACCAALLSCTGCSGLFSSPEFHETVVCDLGFPEVREPLPFSLTVRSFSSDTSARYKMLFRIGEQLRPDEFACWSRTPAEMLTRHCRIAFSRSMDRSAPNAVPAREFVLTGSVLAFEADLNEKVCRLYVRCTLSDAENNSGILWSKTFFVTAPAIFSQDAPGKGAATAMRQAAETFVHELSRDLASLDLTSAEKKPARKEK